MFTIRTIINTVKFIGLFLFANIGTIAIIVSVNL